MASLQEVQVPRTVAEAPFRKRPLPHVGWSLHVPLLVAEWPDRYCPLEHELWSPHEYPLVVPEHEPERNLLSPQLMFEHGEHE